MVSGIPISFSCSFISCSSCSTTSAGASVIRPPMGRGRAFCTFPSTAIARPPLFSLTQFPARTISASFVPTTIRLWESWAMLEATAPFFSPYPCKNPSPICPVSWWRSNTAIFIISRSKSTPGAYPSFSFQGTIISPVRSSLSCRQMTL